MRVLLAGATGAIGRPIVQRLQRAGHSVIGLTTREDGIRWLQSVGADGARADALDPDAMQALLHRTRPDAVIDQLTALPREYTPETMRATAALSNRLRLEGGANLQRAAEAVGVQRYLVQSSGFWMEAGDGIADETVPLAVNAPGVVGAGSRVFAAVEARVLGSTALGGTALRYGFFWGPGTWFDRNGSMADSVRARQVPLVGDGSGVYVFVHVEDAADATVAALEAEPGIYNVVDDRPTPQAEWLPAFARWVGAEPPPRLSEQEAEATVGPDAVYYATRLRGASNAKARRVLGFRPRLAAWMDSQ